MSELNAIMSAKSGNFLEGIGSYAQAMHFYWLASENMKCVSTGT